MGSSQISPHKISHDAHTTTVRCPNVSSSTKITCSIIISISLHTFVPNVYFGTCSWATRVCRSFRRHPSSPPPFSSLRAVAAADASSAALIAAIIQLKIAHAGTLIALISSAFTASEPSCTGSDVEIHQRVLTQELNRIDCASTESSIGTLLYCHLFPVYTIVIFQWGRFFSPC